MTKIKKGIFGPISGKLGPIVGATWKGIAYIRMAPKKRKKKAKRTPAQIASQFKFKYLNNWLIPFHPYVTHGFKHLAASKTEINAAFTANYKAALNGSYPDFSIGYSQVLLSVGQLPILCNPSISWVNERTINLTWATDLNVKSAYDDQLMLVVYSPALEKADGFIGGTKRAELQCIFAINNDFVGYDLECYVSLISLNGKQVSNSLYLGRMQTP